MSPAKATFSSGSQKKLFMAAEEAFAQSGIEGASIRQINGIAGQRNTSAIRYHFGSKDGLLEALIERRMGALDRERAANRSNP